MVPPHATFEAARTAMARAVQAGNVTQAEQILIDTGIRRAHPVLVEEPKTGRERGEP
ncbi:hypothetical protein GCM10010341_60340 [Streptomyces noursei]|nr:hypothetical protein GCM10010341_60340 [Streptomyces noursei]